MHGYMQPPVTSRAKGNSPIVYLCTVLYCDDAGTSSFRAGFISLLIEAKQRTESW